MNQVSGEHENNVIIDPPSLNNIYVDFNDDSEEEDSIDQSLSQPNNAIVKIFPDELQVTCFSVGSNSKNIDNSHSLR